MSRSLYEHEFVVDSLSHHPDVVRQVVNLAWSEWGKGRADEEYQRWIQLAEEDCRANTKFSAGFVALSGDVLVGSVALHEFDIAAMRDRSPWVSGMIIKPGYRGLGAGRALLQELESFAATEHVDTLWVFTESAAGFYQKYGWSPYAQAMHEGNLGMVLTKQLRI